MQDRFLGRLVQGMEVLDKHEMRASVLLNADVCRYHKRIIEKGNRRNREWLGHGETNSHDMSAYGEGEEREVIARVRETITEATGKAPRGWLGPGLVETFDTLDHLAAEGFEYISDWACDDQPVPMRVKSGRMIVVPYGPPTCRLMGSETDGTGMPTSKNWEVEVEPV